MVQRVSSTLPRDAIADFIASPRGIRAFEDLQNDNAVLFDAINNASFLVLAADPDLTAAQVLKLGNGLIAASANGEYTLSLATTGVTPKTYSSPTSITVDATGRITAIS